MTAIVPAPRAERMASLAGRLARLGVRAGDRVATRLEPSATAVELIHAAAWMGAVLVPLDPRLTACERDRLLAIARPVLVVDDPALLDDPGSAPAPIPAAVLPPDAPHSIVFTSGTSGLPKGVVLTRSNHGASACGVCTRLGVGATDRWLLCMPLAHVAGLGIVVRSAAVGFEVVVLPRFEPEAFVRTVADARVTVVSVVAAMLARVLDVATDEPAALTSLRCILVGGGPLPAPVLARARALGLPVAPTYGLTEAASMVTCEVTGVPGEPGTVGTPITGVEVRIANADDDGVGEILVRGPVVTPGYLEDLPATAPALRDGWLHTGDLGRIDADGALHVVGRRSDVIITGGENVQPTEIEAVLLAHPGIAEAYAYGVPDDRWGDRIEAQVVFRGAAIDPGALSAWCTPRLARFKVPKVFHPVAHLPRTASGKLRREPAGRS